MSFWSAVVVIFAIASYTYLRSQGLTRRSNRDRGAVASDGTHEAELQREVESLRERIAVLERIATDDERGRSLAREIDSLKG